MKELLSLLPRPSHYIGTEEGSVHKEPASVRLHCALAFPDLYEVGMSYLGHKILYAILNNREDIFAERVYAPCRETGRSCREAKVPSCKIEPIAYSLQTALAGGPWLVRAGCLRLRCIWWVLPPLRAGEAPAKWRSHLAGEVHFPIATYT